MATKTAQRLAMAVIAVVLLRALWLNHLPDRLFYSDDFVYVGWALSHPVLSPAALTEEVFQHIRPLTLASWWLGLRLSDAAGWGPELVRTGLIAVGAVGVLGWTRSLAEHERVGWLATVLACLAWTGDDAFTTASAGWLSWMNAVGEWACAAGALWLAATAGTHRSRWAAVALLLLLGGGFKESGWLLAPGAVLLVAGPGRWPLRAGIAVLSLVGLGATAFTSGNLDRYGAEQGLGSLLSLDVLQNYAGLLVSTDPFTDTSAGLPLAWWPLLLLSIRERWTQAALWMAGGAVLIMAATGTAGAIPVHVGIGIWALTGVGAVAAARALLGSVRWQQGLAVLGLLHVLGDQARLQPAEQANEARPILEILAAIDQAGAPLTACANERPNSPFLLMLRHLAPWGVALRKPTGAGVPILVNNRVQVRMLSGLWPPQGVTGRPGQELDVEPGAWMLSASTQTVLVVDQCNHRWELHAPEQGWAVRALDLEPGCGPLKVSGRSGDVVLSPRPAVRASWPRDYVQGEVQSCPGQRRR